MSTSFKSIQSVIAFVLVLLVHSFLSVREALCGTTRDENEDHEDALFVLVLPPLLALFTLKKVRKVSLLVFAFVRILVVVAKPPPLLVKEVIIIITERERDYSNSQGDGQQRPKRGDPLHASSFRLSRTQK